MSLVVQEAAQVQFSGTLSIADSGTDFTRASPTPITATCTMSGLANDNGRQSAKVDLGANRYSDYEVLASLEMGSTPTNGTKVEFYWAPSTSGTAANGNTMGNSGSDAAAPNGAVPSGLSLDQFIAACDYIGSLTVANIATSVQSGFVGVFSPSSRYGQLVVVNRTGAAFVANNDEHHVVFNPLVYTDV